MSGRLGLVAEGTRCASGGSVCGCQKKPGHTIEAFCTVALTSIGRGNISGKQGWNFVKFLIELSVTISPIRFRIFFLPLLGLRNVSNGAKSGKR